MPVRAVEFNRWHAVIDHCAGISQPHDSISLPPADWARMVEVQLNGVLWFARTNSSSRRAALEPPAAQRDTRPDRFDHPEWPGSLQEAINPTHHPATDKRHTHPVPPL